MTRPAPLFGQATQVARGVARANNEEQIDSAVRVVQGLIRTTSQMRADTSSVDRLVASRVEASRIDDRAAAVLAARDTPREFFRRYRELGAYAQSVGLRSAPVPALGTLAEDVVFTVGLDAALGAYRSSHVLSINTNLLGAAAATAISGLGAAKLGEYFTDNVAAGIAVPLNKRAERPTSQLGLGLGQVMIRSVALWPVVGIDQADAADRRIPTGVTDTKPDQSSWSSPVLAIATSYPLAANVCHALSDRQFVAVFSAGVRLPYYYPGDSFGALAALFTKDRSGYMRGGRGALVLSVATPLYRINRIMGSASDTSGEQMSTGKNPKAPDCGARRGQRR